MFFFGKWQCRFQVFRRWLRVRFLCVVSQQELSPIKVERCRFFEVIYVFFFHLFCQLTRHFNDGLREAENDSRFSLPIQLLLLCDVEISPSPSCQHKVGSYISQSGDCILNQLLAPPSGTTLFFGFLPNMEGPTKNFGMRLQTEG